LTSAYSDWDYCNLAAASTTARIQRRMTVPTTATAADEQDLKGIGSTATPRPRHRYHGSISSIRHTRFSLVGVTVVPINSAP